MNIFIEMIRALSFGIVRPPYVFILIIASYIFYKRNLKVIASEKMVIGRCEKGAIELTVSQIVFGILGGGISSLILTALGVTFSSESRIELLVIIAFLLTFIRSRFICFSYAGAILGILSLILKFMGINEIEIYIPSLIAIVAVLHIVEGILVILDGSSGAIPVFTYRKNEILGGFILKRYWAMPVALIFFQSGSDINFINVLPNRLMSYNGLLKMDILSSVVLGFGLFYGAIGYNAVTFTKAKKEKSRISGIFIFFYGCIMLIFSVISKNGVTFQVLSLIIMPLLHEGMIQYQSLRELNGKPKFVSDEYGIMVLDVSKDSEAFKCGIKSGYRVIAINDVPVKSEKQVYREIENKSTMHKLRIKVRDILGEIRTIDFNTGIDRRDLGIILVPRKVNEDKIVSIDNNNFKEILSGIINKK